MVGKELYGERAMFLYDLVDPDDILEAYDLPDFSEYITTTGGDVCRYRIYGCNPPFFELVEK